MLHFKIRIANQKDLPEIIKLRELVIKDTYLLPQYGITDQIIENFFKAEEPKLERYIQYMQTSQYVIAETDGQIIGMCAGCQDGVLRSMYVHPEYQRQGMGRKLILEAIRIMKMDYKCSTISLETASFIEKAVRFYESMGFESKSGTPYKMFEEQRKPFPTVEFTLKPIDQNWPLKLPCIKCYSLGHIPIILYFLPYPKSLI
ncbi:MAG: GNAT family N-acetyltransferase [bacterium]